MKKITAILLTILILCASTVTAFAAPAADEAMRLSEFSGTVTVKNASGVALKAEEGMPLYNGYTVETGPASTALVKLDATKEITLDSRTLCSVKHSGKKAEVFLFAGTVFFNSDVPLRSNEAFIIRSKDIVNSIRGSFGWQNPTGVGLLYGRTHVDIVGGTVDLIGGKKVDVAPEIGSTVIVIDGGKDLTPSNITADSVPAIAAAAVAADPAMQGKLENAGKIDVNAIIGSADSKKAGEAAAEQAAVASAQAAAQAQGAAMGTTVVFPSGSSAEAVKPSQPPSPSGGEGGSSGGDSGTSVSGNAADSQALMAQLSGGNATLDPGGWTISYTGVTVGAGQTLNITGSGTVSMPALTIEAGATVNVFAGATLAVSGTDLVWRGTLTNNGTTQNGADTALLGSVVNNGTFTNSGTFAVAPGASFTGGTVSNSGTVISNGTFSPGACDGVVIRK